MKIIRVTSDLYHIPLPTMLSDSVHGTMPYFELVTVRLDTDDGLEGLGYTYTVGKGGCAIQALLATEIAPQLTGADPRRIEDLWQQMWWSLHYGGRGGPTVLAISAVDIALWDLRGKQAGEPLWRLLGGHSNRVRAYAGGVDLHFTLDDLREQTRRFIDSGVRAIKMKVGHENLVEDVMRVAAIRDLLGPEIPLMVDANMIWSVETAVRAARALVEYDIYWLEEPTIPDDIEGHVRIQREGGLPVATGENMHTLYEFQHMISRGGVTFPEPDVSNCGGITIWMKIAHLAESHNLRITSHGVHDLAVHLLSAVPNDSLLEIHGFELDRFMSNSLLLEDGYAIAPDHPGHGITLLWEAMDEYLINAG